VNSKQSRALRGNTNRNPKSGDTKGKLLLLPYRISTLTFHSKHNQHISEKTIGKYRCVVYNIYCLTCIKENTYGGKPNPVSPLKSRIQRKKRRRELAENVRSVFIIDNIFQLIVP
jgi:hypothetical protein